MDSAITNSTSTRRAAFAGRPGRLPALCVLSLLLHLSVLAWLDVRVAPPAPAGTPGLAIRLARPPAPAATTEAAQMAAPPLPVPAVADTAAPVVGASPAAPDQARPAPPVSAAAPGGEPIPVPSRYRVAVPPSAHLVYEVQDAAGASDEAWLDWNTDGVQYRLALDGILGSIESEGGTDDAGIAPQRASYRQGAGSASIAFARERGTIAFESVGRSAQDMPGSQDGATLLMQLTGIALADPDQLHDSVELYVGRASSAAVERFQVLGRTQLATPMGSMETLHLARAGGKTLEIWLAPAHGYLPVQMRTSGPGGQVRTQVIKEIRIAPAR